MKNTLGKSCALLLGLFCFTECNKELDLKPLGNLNSQTFYQTEKDFEAASLGPYSAMLNLYFSQNGSGWYQTQLFPDDDVVPANNTNNNQDEFNWTSGNQEFLRLWTHCYNGIGRANLIIDALPKAKSFTDEANKNRYEAEAKFIRAYLYFVLQTNFGNVPKIEKPVSNLEQSKLPNSQPGEIWDLIIADLQFAKQNLPPSHNGANTGRATSGSAAALLGKTYLYRAQWDKNNALYTNAINELTEVAVKYTLSAKWDDNFSPKTENNPESIFEIQFSEGGTNPWLSTDFNDEASAGTGRQIYWMASCGPGNKCAPGANGLGYGGVHISAGLQKEFELNDPRRASSIYQDGDDYFGTPYSKEWSGTGSTPAKYIKQEGSTEVVDYGKRFPFNRSVNNERIIRLADVLLMLAEAKLLGNNDVAGAAELINRVRRRVDPTGLLLPDRPAASTQAEMFTFLRHERRVELALEGHRYQDLVRWHRAGLIDIRKDVDFGSTTANQSWSTKNLIKPIPQAELDLNPALQQNAEYK